MVPFTGLKIWEEELLWGEEKLIFEPASWCLFPFSESPEDIEVTGEFLRTHPSWEENEPKKIYTLLGVSSTANPDAILAVLRMALPHCGKTTCEHFSTSKGVLS